MFIGECAEGVQSLASQLAFIRCVVLEEDQIMIILNGLNIDYDSFVANVQERCVKLQEVLHKLLSHESRLKRRNGCVPLLPIANLIDIGVTLKENLTQQTSTIP